MREEEKTRIARELHDDLGQQLTALKMDLSVVEQQLRAPGRAQPDDGMLSHLQAMRRLIGDSLAVPACRTGVDEHADTRARDV